MKSLDRISFLTNVLVVACQRPSTEVGKLVKALVTYATEGKRTELNDIRLETFFDLIAQDLDMQRMASEEKSRKCSESAKSRTARNGNAANSPAKKANIANATNSKQKANADDANESITDSVSSCSGDSNDSANFDAADVTSSFERMKVVYIKLGNNESQAFDAWRQLSDDERSAAFAHVQRMQGDPNSRNYLFVYLRDKEWTKNVESGKQ
ncbi:MAG: hypothetical protein AUK63_2453 [bacterium P3]|jgi:uncharacterized protein YdaU (DUF1376 family)|nr:MAG: hypothetical protein AUK63_2453 [bacterium P3]KWW27826.1 MAG: hypothetical protein F083_2932 [bacterium F083]